MPLGLPASFKRMNFLHPLVYKNIPCDRLLMQGADIYDAPRRRTSRGDAARAHAMNETVQEGLESVFAQIRPGIELVPPLFADGHDKKCETARSPIVFSLDRSHPWPQTTAQGAMWRHRAVAQAGGSRPSLKRAED